MKKFLLSLAAFVAMTASAEVVLDNPNPWGATCGLEGSTYSMDGSWAGAGTYLIVDEAMYDASANDYAMLKYSGNTGKFSFKVIYNKFDRQEAWGPVYVEGNTTVSDAEGIAYIKLNKTDVADGGKTFAEEIREIQLQDQGAAVTFTVEKLAFITQEEYDALNGGDVDPEPAPGVNHVLKLTQADAKANPWDTQVFIKVSGLEANKKYVVTLDVMGGSEFTLGSESIDDVQQDHKDQWGNSAVFNYTDEIKVTTEWSVGTVNFPGVTTVDCDTHKEKHENTEYAATALLLNVGKTAGDLYIDNVVVKDEEGNVVYTQDFEEATCGADDVTKDAHFFGWQNATWAIVEAEGPTSLGALEAVNADAVAYDLFGNAGATKGFMVKGGKKVYVK